MKNIIAFVFLLLCSGYIFGQNCVRNIRTKWDNPNNNELTPFFPGKINPWINTFNIGNNDGAAFYSIPLNPHLTAGWAAGVPLLMTNPFAPGPSQYDYLRQPVGGSVNDMDYHWEDGWEVMWLNTGYYPNGERIDSANVNRIITGANSVANGLTPYIILYNKYQGKLRVFTNVITHFNAFQNARLRLEHPNLQQSSGLFRHMANYDKALEDSTDIRLTASTNHSNLNNTNIWWSSDFQLGYDPCVCKYLSNIEFRVQTIKSFDVDLFGRSVQRTLPLNTALNEPDYANFLTNEGVREGLNSGSLLYKSFDQLMADYDAELNAYNTQLRSYNSFFNTQARQLISTARIGVQDAGGFFLNDAIGGVLVRGLVKINGATKDDSTNSKKWAESVSNNAKGLLGNAFDFLTVSALGKEFFEAPQRPSMPTATFEEMRLAGTIVDSGQIFIASFLTPGSYKFPQVLTPHNYPAYNEVPGLYALLRRPRVNVFTENTLEIDTTFTQLVPDPFGGPPILLGRYKKASRKKVFIRLRDPLQYTLNPAVDFDYNNTKLFVSFQVELENNEPALNGDTAYNPTEFKYEPSQFYLENAFPDQSGRNHVLKFNSKWVDMETAGEALFDLDFSDTVEGFDDLFRPGQFISFRTNRNREMSDYIVKKITMKVAADMYFNRTGTNGLQNNTFQTFTYLLFDANTGTNITFPILDSLELLRFKKRNIFISNDTIEPTDSFVFEVRDTTIYINAENIQLSGSITVTPGFAAILQATNSITGISGTTTIGRNIHLKRVNGFTPFGNISRMNQTDVDAFCLNNSDGYKANRARSKWGGTEPDTLKSEAPSPKTTVYPNPATAYFYVTTTVDEEMDYHFVVYDLTGRKLIDETVNGSNRPQFEITTDALSAGTYFLNITTPDGKISDTHRIIIIK